MVSLWGVPAKKLPNTYMLWGCQSPTAGAYEASALLAGGGPGSICHAVRGLVDETPRASFRSMEGLAMAGRCRCSWGSLNSVGTRLLPWRCRLPHTRPFIPQRERLPDRSAEEEACETEGCRRAVGCPVSPLCCGHAPSWRARPLVPNEHIGVV